jgi:hypothetical protein
MPVRRYRPKTSFTAVMETKSFTRLAKDARWVSGGKEDAMRPFLIGVLAVVVLTVLDYSYTGGFYTGKLTEMSERIMQSFSR